ncbi:MAG: CBS domain-containing protein [Methanobacteriota archaeon]|nr:MAG: CBS domain-containing protein [Euryarchaeota archaeon]
MGTNIKVSDVMKSNVIVIPAGAPVVEAAKLMSKHSIGSVVVIEENEARGIVTERDIIRKVVASNKQATVEVSKIMSSPLIVSSPDITVEEAAKIMNKHGIKRLPLIDDKGYIVGIITENDILKLLPSLIDLIEERSLIGQ